MSTTDPFVSVDWLRDHPEALVFDCRHYYDGRDGRAAYEAGHIPGAVFVSLDDDLAGPPGPSGNSPLPTPDAFTGAAQRLGIHPDSTVVAYDDAGGYIAGRLWWLLDSVGVDARVLAGGIGSWTGELDNGPSFAPDDGTLVVAGWPPDRFATAADVAAADRDTVVVDSRSHPRYTGEAGGSERRQGHVPGAVSAPATGNLDNLEPRTPAELRDRFRELGVADDTTVIAYCGAGVSAGLNLLALRRAGNRDARLYVGSWSEWGNDPQRPVATGPEPGGRRAE